MSEVSKYNVLDDKGLDTLLQSIFKTIEENYVRRSSVDEEVQKSIAKYSFTIKDDGCLYMSIET